MVAGVVLALFAVAAAAPLVSRMLGTRAHYALALAPAAATAWLAMQASAVAHGAVPSASYDWLPGLGVRLAFRLDGLALLFALLITGIGTLVVLYGGTYLKGHPRLHRFHAVLLLFMASMVGLALSDDVVGLFVFWELTSISSYFLIGFEHDEAASRKRALQALLVTGGGGLALLAGLLLLASAAGTSSIAAASASGLVAASPMYPAILALVALGAFTKSAQVPFHFWLPGAMVAPTPVSAYLHSATMVKAGVYLLARLHPTLGGTPAWETLLGVVGALTLLTGAILALRQTDLKLVLAYTTVSALGGMTMLLGVGGEHGAVAAVGFLLAHALYKGALFLVAGIVDHGAGTRDVRRLAGLRRTLPWTTAAALAAALSFAGVLPMFGFVAKELALDAVLHAHGSLRPVLLALALPAFAFLATAAATVGVLPFFGRATDVARDAHEAPWTMLAGPLLLAAASLALGLLAPQVGDLLVGPAADVVAGEPLHAHLALWHGVNFPLLLSVAALAGGLAILPGRARLWVASPAWLEAVTPSRAYDAAVSGLVRGAKGLTRLLQNGRLRTYLAVILSSASAVALAALLRGRIATGSGWADVLPHEAMLAAAMAAAALAVPFLRSRLGAVAVLGVVGYSIAALFIGFGAPDLALTQFLFETLTVLIFIGVLRGLPKQETRSALGPHLRDAALALLVGLLVTLLLLATASHQLSPTISSFYGEASYEEAHGRNVVNVILVDFRGLDTLGEITVLGVAATGVAALLGLRPPRRRKAARPTVESTTQSTRPDAPAERQEGGR